MNLFMVHPEDLPPSFEGLSYLADYAPQGYQTGIWHMSVPPTWGDLRAWMGIAEGPNAGALPPWAAYTRDGRVRYRDIDNMRRGNDLCAPFDLRGADVPRPLAEFASMCRIVACPRQRVVSWRSLLGVAGTSSMGRGRVRGLTSNPNGLQFWGTYNMVPDMAEAPRNSAHYDAVEERWFIGPPGNRRPCDNPEGWIGHFPTEWGASQRATQVGQIAYTGRMVERAVAIQEPESVGEMEIDWAWNSARQSAVESFASLASLSDTARSAAEAVTGFRRSLAATPMIVQVETDSNMQAVDISLSDGRMRRLTVQELFPVQIAGKKGRKVRVRA